MGGARTARGEAAVGDMQESVGLGEGERRWEAGKGHEGGGGGGAGSARDCCCGDWGDGGESLSELWDKSSFGPGDGRWELGNCGMAIRRGAERG